MSYSFTIPFFPPSVNKLYATRRGGGRTLTSAARGFINNFSKHLMSTYLPSISGMNRDSETAYKVEYRFFFDPKRVLNLTYKNGKKTGAKTRFARIDVSNYEKLLSDCLAEAIGVDDCQFFEVTTRKIVATCESPKIIIYVTVIEDDEGQAKYGLRKFWKASE